MQIQTRKVCVYISIRYSNLIQCVCVWHFHVLFFMLLDGIVINNLVIERLHFVSIRERNSQYDEGLSAALWVKIEGIRCVFDVTVMFMWCIFSFCTMLLTAYVEVSALDNCHFLCLASVNIVTALAVGSVSRKRFSRADGKSAKECKKNSLCCLRVGCERAENRIWGNNYSKGLNKCKLWAWIGIGIYYGGKMLQRIRRNIKK